MMPLFTYIDDVIYDGSETAFKKLVLYSSICAILVLDLEAILRHLFTRIFIGVQRSFQRGFGPTRLQPANA